MTPPVFKATFADFKLVKTRSCAQLIFELPIEQADAALQTLGGLPRAATEVWAAIARLQPEKPASEPSNAPAALSPPKEKRKFGEMPPAAQAGMLCADPLFRRFLADRFFGPGNHGPVDLDKAAHLVREICGVQSRSKISEADESANRWRQLDLEFLDWKHSAQIKEVEFR
jgi:hypothetical protein